MSTKPEGRLAIMGNIDVIEPDGEKVNYPKALLIAFDTSDELREAVRRMELSLKSYHDTTN
jgi:hypothetical protein